MDATAGALQVGATDATVGGSSSFSTTKVPSKVISYRRPTAEVETRAVMKGSLELQGLIVPRTRNKNALSPTSPDRFIESISTTHFAFARCVNGYRFY